MTPVLDPRSRAEERYNWSHRATRTVIERCNGILKLRFHCLHGELRVSPERACRIIAACVFLHNRAIDYKRPIDEDEIIAEESNEDADPNPTQDITQGTLVHRRLISNRFTRVNDSDQ